VPVLGSSLTSLQNLATVDLYRYDEAWELEPAKALSQLTDTIAHHVGTVVLDLRKPEDYITGHIPGSYNIPLKSLNASTPSPFFDAATLEQQWKELDAMFTSDHINAHELIGREVHIICYDGDTARVATSVLRAKGISASSVKDGITAIKKELPHLQRAERGEGLRQEEWSKRPQAEIFVKELRVIPCLLDFWVDATFSQRLDDGQYISTAKTVLKFNIMHTRTNKTNIKDTFNLYSTLSQSSRRGIDNRH
jgi:rhodanese-related sulfurtransferase